MSELEEITMCPFCFSDNCEEDYETTGKTYCFECDHEHSPGDAIESENDWDI